MIFRYNEAWLFCSIMNNKSAWDKFGTAAFHSMDLEFGKQIFVVCDISYYDFFNTIFTRYLSFVGFLISFLIIIL